MPSLTTWLKPGANEIGLSSNPFIAFRFSSFCLLLTAHCLLFTAYCSPPISLQRNQLHSTSRPRRLEPGQTPQCPRDPRPVVCYLSQRRAPAGSRQVVHHEECESATPQVASRPRRE